jgi:hypothetical protein
MNIEELDILKELSEQTHFGDLPFLYYADLIGKLLTAYEKEKEKNKELEQSDTNHLSEIGNLRTQLNYEKDEFVSKDKIRLKMKQEMDKGYRLSEERHLQNYAYDRLKELLGEE